MFRSALFLSFALLAAPLAFAQTACPGGVAPGSPQCGPDAGTSRGAPPAPPRPTGEWIKTWGAIAHADNTNEAWASTGMLSKEAAELDAVDQCQSAGFKNCAATFTYRNQCVALASSRSGPLLSGTVSAVDIPTAESEAIKLCKERGGAQCAVIYKDCTEPKFRRY